MALSLAGAVAASAAPCFAAGVEGTLAIKHVVAQLHDNAEGALRRPLRIVVADRPIPEGAIEGIGEIAATQLALDTTAPISSPAPPARRR